MTDPQQITLFTPSLLEDNPLEEKQEVELSLSPTLGRQRRMIWIQHLCRHKRQIEDWKEHPFPKLQKEHLEWAKSISCPTCVVREKEEEKRMKEMRTRETMVPLSPKSQEDQDKRQGLFD